MDELLGLTFSLAGPGRVGTSLAAWARAAGARQVAAAGRAEAGELATGGQDLLLLAVPEAALPGLAAELGRRPQAAVALHTAGSLPASVLAPLAAAGSAVGTLHPLKAFPGPLPDPAEARGVFFGLDGDPAAVALGRRLAAAWGGEAAEVPPEGRSLYHFAASLAAGGAVTLLAAAEELAERLGLPPAVARGYRELCRGAVAAAVAAGDAASAITGPAARGDLETVRRGLDALAEAAPEKAALAGELVRETLRQVARRSRRGRPGDSRGESPPKSPDDSD
jgi:predicted short-subunit dehydrogenase-like oxidoreductase (DUF2520 family)